MAERNCAAIHIDLLFGRAALAHEPQDNRREGFVDLKEVDVVQGRVAFNSNFATAGAGAVNMMVGSQLTSDIAAARSGRCRRARCKFAPAFFTE